MRLNCRWWGATGTFSSGGTHWQASTGSCVAMSHPGSAQAAGSPSEAQANAQIYMQGGGNFREREGDHVSAAVVPRGAQSCCMAAHGLSTGGAVAVDQWPLASSYFSSWLNLCLLNHTGSWTATVQAARQGSIKGGYQACARLRTVRARGRSGGRRQCRERAEMVNWS